MACSRLLKIELDPHNGTDTEKNIRGVIIVMNGFSRILEIELDPHNDTKSKTELTIRAGPRAGKGWGPGERHFGGRSRGMRDAGTPRRSLKR